MLGRIIKRFCHYKTHAGNNLKLFKELVNEDPIDTVKAFGNIGVIVGGIAGVAAGAQPVVEECIQEIKKTKSIAPVANTMCGGFVTSTMGGVLGLHVGALVGVAAGVAAAAPRMTAASLALGYFGTSYVRKLQSQEERRRHEAECDRESERRKMMRSSN